MSKTKLNAAAALNSQKNKTKGGEVIETTLNNTTAEQGTPAEQGTQGEQKGVKFTLNTPNPQFINYLGTRGDEFASEFEKFACDYIAVNLKRNFTRPTNEKAGKAFDSLLNLLASAAFFVAAENCEENFAKYMAKHNPLADYTKRALHNAFMYADSQLKLLSEFGNRAEKAWQNFNRANKEASKAELKSELAAEKDASAAKDAKIAELEAKLAAAAAAAQNESKGA